MRLPPNRVTIGQGDGDGNDNRRKRALSAGLESFASAINTYWRNTYWKGTSRDLIAMRKAPKAITEGETIYPELVDSVTWAPWKAFFMNTMNDRMPADFALYMYCKINM